MAIPKILNDLLDYDDYNRRLNKTNISPAPTCIWVKEGKKEEAWAVCMMLGLIIDSNVEVNGQPIDNTYIFAKFHAPNKANHYAVGVEGRFYLRDLQIYFSEWETDNEA